jgi:hypothetical protein
LVRRRELLCWMEVLSRGEEGELEDRKEEERKDE